MCVNRWMLIQWHSTNSCPITVVIFLTMGKEIRGCFAEEMASGQHLGRWLLVCRMGMKGWCSRWSGIVLGYFDAEYSVTGIEGVGQVERASAQRGESSTWTPTLSSVSEAPGDPNALLTISQVLLYLILSWPVLKIRPSFLDFIGKRVKQKNYCFFVFWKIGASKVILQFETICHQHQALGSIPSLSAGMHLGPCDSQLNKRGVSFFPESGGTLYRQ